MTTMSTSTAIAAVQPVFTSQERLALAGFLAGYTGLTREAYALDLRQYASWCQQHHIRLFQARRADIECFARDLEACGRARATITRRLCTIAGFYKYAVKEDLLEHSPAAHVRRPRLDYESHVTGLDRNELGALLSMRSSRCWLSMACGSPRPPAPTSRPWASSAATAPWSSPAKAARWPLSRSRRGPPGRSTWP
jgi:integrase